MLEKIKKTNQDVLVKIKKFHQDENGDIVQTAIIIGVLAVIAGVALFAMRPTLQNIFQNIQQQLDNV